MPDDYKNLSFLSDIQNIINRTYFEITDEKREILENAFKYVPEFHEKFSKINPYLLDNIFKGIFEKVYLKLLYKDKWLKVAPIKIFLYQGILYVSVIKVYLIGYTGWRFPSRMFVPHIEKIYRPDEEISEIAKRFKEQIKQIDEKVSFSLNENLKRFNEFLENFEYYLEQRYKLLEVKH